MVAVYSSVYTLVLPLDTQGKITPVTQRARVYWVQPETGTIYRKAKFKRKQR